MTQTASGIVHDPAGPAQARNLSPPFHANWRELSCRIPPGAACRFCSSRLCKLLVYRRLARHLLCDRVWGWSNTPFLAVRSPFWLCHAVLPPLGWRIDWDELCDKTSDFIASLHGGLLLGWDAVPSGHCNRAVGRGGRPEQCL
jgi:hypothetical protein